MTAGVDADEFAAMLAQARLAAAGLDPVRLPDPAVPRALAARSAPYRLTAPGPVETVDLGQSDYRITGNDNPVITRRPAGARCRAACGVELAPALADRPDGSGLHANCVEPPTPPSTLADIEGALARFEASRPRSVQTTLGPSELGTPCARQIALKLAGVQRHERSLPWAPMCGTAVHGLMESVLEAENARLGRERWIIEQKVRLDEELSGHGDAYDSDHALVVDWKYTGTTARRKASRRSVPNADLVSREYRVQAHLYGYGHENSGRPVRHVRLVMLARSHDFRESVEWTEEYRPDIAIEAMTRFYAVRDQVVNMDAARFPERLAAVEATPGEACKWCPFQRPGTEVDATGCVGTTASAYEPAAFFK